MNNFALWSKLGICAVALIVGNSPAGNLSKQSPISAACSTPEYHQFDFWIGDWDAFEIEKPGKPQARVRVDRILESCVLREDYQDVNGHKGQSFSIYDATKKMWHQTWVTNRGELLLLDGAFQKGEMVLLGQDLYRGNMREIRGTWKPEAGRVRETAVRSLNGGKSWEPWFDLAFRPHNP
jgi:hypothetical protein